MEHLVNQLLDEENTAAVNSFQLGKALDPLVISMQDGQPVTQDLLQPAHDTVKAMREQVERLETLLKEFSEPLQQ